MLLISRVKIFNIVVKLRELSERSGGLRAFKYWMSVFITIGHFVY